MARSRSLFDDLDTAIATATLLADEAKQGAGSEAPLVSFSQSAPDAEKLPTTMPLVGLSGVAPPVGEAASAHVLIQSAPPLPPPGSPLVPKRPPSQRRPPSQKLLQQTKPSAAHDTAPHAIVPIPIEEHSAGALTPTPVTPDVTHGPGILPPPPGPSLLPSSPAAFSVGPSVAPAAAPSTPPAAMPSVVPSAAPPAAPPAALSATLAAGPAVGWAPSPHSAPPTAAPEVQPSVATDETTVDRKLPPKLPELSGITSPVVRCERIVSWIAEATGATDVFLADASGYPLAGAIDGVDAKLAGTGLVAASIASLAASIPGNVSSLFELHLGDGPFFQLIGFHAGASIYVVGFTRSAPLTPRQSHAIRLACRHALGDTLKGGLWESE